MSGPVEDRHQRCDYVAVFVHLIERAFVKRRNAQKKSLADQESREVCGALLARQMTLAKHLAYTPNFWTPYVAPQIFRCMTDININLAWISRDVERRSKQFIEYGLGQAKRSLEHRRSKPSNKGKPSEQFGYLEAMTSWVNGQRIEPLVDVKLGSWSGKSTREMAREAECEEVYEFEYTSMCRFSHVDWVSTFTLHQFLLGESKPEFKPNPQPELDSQSRPNELYMMTKMMIHAITWYDNATGFSSNDTLRLKQFRDFMKPKTSSEVRNSITNDFTVQPVSSISVTDFQGKFEQSSAIILDKTFLGIKLRIDRIKEASCEPDIKAVLIPLLGRMASLMGHYIEAPVAWNVHIGPIILRALAEILLTIVWLSGDLSKRSSRFIDQSLLQARKDLLHLDKSLKEKAFSSDVKAMSEFMKSWIESLEQLVPRKRNRHRIPSLRKMAESGDYLDFYNIEVSEWSACVHSSWHHVGIYNLIFCENPLHRYHELPIIAPLQCDSLYLRSALMCCQDTLEIIDGIPMFAPIQPGPSLLDVFKDSVAGLQAKEPRSRSDSGLGRGELDKSSVVHGMKCDNQYISEQIEQIRTAAMSGDSEAQFLLGQITWNEDDPSEAVRLFVQAAEQGHVRAQFQLAQIHARGPEAFRDFVKALAWLTRLTMIAEIEAELEDEIVALKLDISSNLSVEQLSDARERALSGTI